MKWSALWCCLILAFLIQWSHWSADQSVSLNWAAWASLAAGLSFLEERPRRSARFPIFLILISLVGVRYLCDIVPTLIFTPWTSAWGTLAVFGSGACWLTIVLFGTVSVVRNSPPIDRLLPKALFGFILSCLALVYLHEEKIYSFWKISENPGGFLPTIHIFADICTISLPILFSWAWWACIPALVGIVVGKSITAVVGILAGIAWLVWKSENRRILGLGLAYAAIASFLFMARTSWWTFYQLITLRVRTWFVVLLTIYHHPIGIGMDPMSYDREVFAKTAVHILPHSASDALNTVLYGGWITIPIFGYLSYQGLVYLENDPESVSIVMMAAMACFAKVLGFPQVALVGWVIWMSWKIKDSEKVKFTSPAYLEKGEVIYGPVQRISA